MGLNGRKWTWRDKVLNCSSLFMLTKLFYTAFHMHGTHEMGWLLYLDALKGRKEQVAAWTPKRPHRWRDGKDKEPEVSPRLSLRHLAILTMSNLPLDPRLPMQSPSCCCIHVGLVDTNICRLLLSFCGAMLSFSLSHISKIKYQGKQPDNYWSGTSFPREQPMLLDSMKRGT